MCLTYFTHIANSKVCTFCNRVLKKLDCIVGLKWLTIVIVQFKTCLYRSDVICPVKILKQAAGSVLEFLSTKKTLVFHCNPNFSKLKLCHTLKLYFITVFKVLLNCSRNCFKSCHSTQLICSILSAEYSKTIVQTVTSWFI